MTSQSVALRNHRFQNGVPAYLVIATRRVRACVRKAAGSKWWLLFSMGVGMLRHSCATWAKTWICQEHGALIALRPSALRREVMV